MSSSSAYCRRTLSTVDTVANTDITAMGDLASTCRNWHSVNAAGLALLTNSLEKNNYEKAAQTLSCLNDALCQTAAYRKLCAGAQYSSSDHKPWLWQKLYQDTRIRIGLLTVYKRQPVPLHDHPGSSGALFLLTGSVEIDQYDHMNLYSQSDCAGLVLLHRTGNAVLTEREVSIFGVQHGNIHGLNSKTESSVMLNVLLEPYAPGDRSWYIPIYTDSASDSVLLTERLNSALIRSMLATEAKQKNDMD